MKTENKITQQEFEKIERYLTHAMDADEQASFEKEIASNTQLQQKVNEVSILISGVEAASLKDKLEEYHTEIQPTHSVVKKPNTLIQKGEKSRIPWLAIAASLVVIFSLYWMFNQDSKNEKLFAEYYTPDPGLPTTMSTTNEYSFYEGMVDYKRGEYRTAIQKWETLQDSENPNDTLTYFLGVANLAAQNEEKAIDYLENTLQFTNSIFLQDGHYYLGLAYLKQGNVEKAADNFRKSNTETSKQILKELEN